MVSHLARACAALCCLALAAPSPAQTNTHGAARLLEQASFGPTPGAIGAVKSLGPAVWVKQQLAMPASAVPAGSDLDAVRRQWYLNMAQGPDQLRQRMIFALSQLFVVSTNKNNEADQITPWLSTLSTHAFGNFGELLREMTLNPAMGKYLDLGNSMAPSPNENYAREVMQLFTVGPVLLNQDGSVQHDLHGEPIATYTQDTIGDVARALSGWTYAGANSTGRNRHNMSAPLQGRERFHDTSAKTLLNGITTPAGQGIEADFEAVMNNLFQHPNVAPFIATRLIRHFVMSNPSPAYISRVAAVFSDGGRGRGDLAATLQAVLLDAEARANLPTASSGRLKDPMLHTLGLIRAMNGSVINPDLLFWEYSRLGQKIAGAPSVFSFYSPLTALPDAPELAGPEFQIYAPAQAVARANLTYRLLTGELGEAVRIDLAPYVGAAANPDTLLDMVDQVLLAGRMSAGARSAIRVTLLGTTDLRQRAISALYLSAITAEFVISQ